MVKYNRINILLRLAGLCSPCDAERKKAYMDEIDDLLLSTRLTNSPVEDLLDLFDFDALKHVWRWMKLPQLLQYNSVREFGLDRNGLGRRLSRISIEEIGVKRKHSNNGTQYYLPPIKISNFVPADTQENTLRKKVSTE